MSPDNEPDAFRLSEYLDKLFPGGVYSVELNYSNKKTESGLRFVTVEKGNLIIGDMSFDVNSTELYKFLTEYTYIISDIVQGFSIERTTVSILDFKENGIISISKDTIVKSTEL